jgi:cytochrome c553
VTQLKAFRSGTRTHEIMSLIAKDLSDEDIENLAAWYSGIEIDVRMPE